MPPKKNIIQKPWTNQHENKFNAFFNIYKKLHPEAVKGDFIDKNKRSIMNFIENKDNWTNGTKENYLFMIARYLHNKGDKRYSKLYSTKGYEYMQKNRAKEDQNQQDEKEKINYRSHDFFINLINSIDQTKIETKKEHMKYLLLNILVYQPPLRSNFYLTAKFLRRKIDNDKKNNYVWINRRGQLKINFIVNKDKASNYKIYNLNKNLNYIPIEDKNLTKLINESFQKYPRTYLLENNEKAISQNTLLNWLREITGIEGLNVDIMRSSYITWFYEHNQTMQKKTKLAHQMRHSVDTAQRNYLKVFDNEHDENNDPVELKNKNEELLLEIAKLQRLIKETPLKENNIKNEDTKLYKKRRSDIIYRLNKGTKPREQTLKKYNIKYDDEQKKYI